MDVSGSMGGFPMQVTKKLMRNLLSNLRPSDKFNLMLFASNASVYAEESVYADKREIENALNLLDQRTGSGGTRLMNALTRATKIPKCNEGLSRSIVVVTDGFISVERDVFDLIHNNKEFNFFSFGIGRSVNRHLIEGIAHVGGGEPLVILNEEEAAEKAQQFRKLISSPVLSDIELDWGDFDVYDLEPNTLTDLLAERPIVISGKYKGDARGLIELKGVSGSHNYKAVYNAAYAKSSTANKSLSYLWARNRIKILDDYINLSHSDSNQKEVTDLGLKYNLLTRFTSFVAVDESPALALQTQKSGVNRASQTKEAGQNVSSKNQHLTTVKQALPLPKDVSGYAIGHTASYANNASFGAELNISNRLSAFDFSEEKKILKLKAYDSASRKFLETRPSITFILGEDEKKGSNYFANAKKYFLNDADAQSDFFVDTCSSLLAVRNQLEELLPAGAQAWGKINLVLHSNQWTGMSLSTIGVNERTTVDALLEAAANGKLPALSNDVLDKHSLIDIKACGLGDNEKLLAALQQALGGGDENMPGVKSTSNFVYFEESAGKMASKSLKPFYAFYKTAYRPAALHLKRQFETRYPEVEIDWMTAMRLKEPRWDGDAFHTRFNVPVEWELIFESNDEALKVLEQEGEVAFVKTQKALMDLLEKFEIPVDKFRWTVTKKKLNGKVEVLVKGKSTVLCVLVETTGEF